MKVSLLIFGGAVGWLISSFLSNPPIKEWEGWVMLGLIVIGLIFNFFEKDK